MESDLSEGESTALSTFLVKTERVVVAHELIAASDAERLFNEERFDGVDTDEPEGDRKRGENGGVTEGGAEEGCLRDDNIGELQLVSWGQNTKERDRVMNPGA